jgi:hypothetical protein
MTDKPDALTAAKAPPARVPVTLGITPTTIDEAWRLAQNFADSDLVPKDYKGKPANVLAAMQLGAELGLAPMQALQSIAVTGAGKPSLYGDGLLAVVLSSSAYRDHVEYYEVDGARRDGLTADDLAADATHDVRAVCTFWRTGQPDPTTRTFSIAQAKRAGLWKKDGPWNLYPDRMLKMRARSWAARDTFADVLRGLHSAEEVADEPAAAEPRRVPRLSDPHDFTDRTADTRLDDAPPDRTIPAGAIFSDPGPITVDLGPASIVALDEHTPPDDEMFWTITLDTGDLVDTIHADRATALRPYVGTGHRFLLSCTRDGSALDLVGWALVASGKAD